MDSTENIRNMRENLAEIEKILTWVEKSKEISQIDIDVLLEKTRNLYNNLISLPVGRIELLMETPEEEWLPVSPPMEEPVAVPDPVREPEPVRKPEPVEIPIPIIEPQPVPEPVPIPQPEPVEEPTAFFPTFQPTIQKPDKQPVRETIGEMSLFQRDSSLNETLGKQKPVHDVASSITETAVSDIWSAITINERFLFIRELFSNDHEGFKNTVTLLNSLNSWEAAKKFMTDRFEWDKNNPVAEDFLNVVRRRFLR